MAGKRQKLPSELVNKRPERMAAITPVPPGTFPAPAPPQNLSARATQLWTDLWASPLAGVFELSDVPTLERWAWWVDAYWTATGNVAGDAEARRWIRQCEAAIRELEKAFGMDPLSRIRLGITLAQGVRESEGLRAKVAAPDPYV